jgi:exosome complex exonuclease DIS3/RRP44
MQVTIASGPERLSHEIRRTRKGKILMRVYAKYLREDLPCGFSNCTSCSNFPGFELCTLEQSRPVIIPDATLLSKYYDLFTEESDLMKSAQVVLLNSVLESVRQDHLPVFRRIQRSVLNKMGNFADKNKFVFVFNDELHRFSQVDEKIGESFEEKRARQVIGAVRWLKKHAKENRIFCSVSLVSLDEKLVNSCKNEGVEVFGNLNNWAQMFLSDDEQKKRISDLCFSYENSMEADVREGNLFPDHLPIRDLDGLVLDSDNTGVYKCKIIIVSGGKKGICNIVSNGSPMTIIVEGMTELNRAITGDTVAVKLISSNEEEKKGLIVGIFSRNKREICGTIEDNPDLSRSWVIFVPIDKNLPWMRLSTKQADKLVGMRIQVAFDGWNADRRSPDCHLIKILGKVGDREVETQVLLLEHNVPVSDSWSEAIIRCLPPADWKPVESDLYPNSHRRDLRHLRIFSIDPPGCKDIDDALHARKLENGNIEIGVHIADVTHFMKPGTALDEEASNRSTSVYLVDRRIDMIPSLLSTDICSLHANVERYAFSVVWEMKFPSLEVVEKKFFKSLILSKAAFAYGQAQEFLDDPNKGGEFGDDVRLLNEVAVILKERRIKAGALTLASPEVKFLLDSGSQDPTEMELYQLKQANALVEEFMLLANITVAEEIYKNFPKFALLRRHQPPPHQNFAQLTKMAETIGFELKTEDSKSVADSLDSIKDDSRPHLNQLIRIMTTRCMMQAVYFPSGQFSNADFKHYGLASLIYTHFTSPIRRYADVIVHRLLAASIGIEKLPLEIMDTLGMQSVCDVMNMRTRMAAMAGRASVELYKLIFFEGKEVKADAIVCRMTSKGVDVFIPEFGIEGSIYFSSLAQELDEIKKEQESNIFEEQSSSSSSPESSSQTANFDEENFNFSISGKSLKIFDALQVLISVSEAAGSRKYLKMQVSQWPEEYSKSQHQNPKRKRIQSSPHFNKKTKTR